MSSFRETLKQVLLADSFDFTGEQLDMSVAFRDYLLERNRVMNLTGLTEDRDIAVKHFLDSLYLLRCGEIKDGSTLLDIGSGAGFPGMVCRIFRPDLKIFLMDSLEKRCGFLQELCNILGTEDVTVLKGRAEEFGRKEEYRGAFDYVTARAVANAAVLAEYGIPFLKEGGSLLMMKGREETTVPEGVLSELNCGAVRSISYSLEGDGRNLISVIKQGPTPEKYPRRPGVPAKKPLK